MGRRVSDQVGGIEDKLERRAKLERDTKLERCAKLGRKAKLGKIAAFISGSLILLCAVAGAKTELSRALEGAILAKALNYDQTIRERGGHPIVLVVSASPNSSDADTVAKAFRALKSRVTVVTETYAVPRVGGASAVYAFEGQYSKALRDACLEHGVLSMVAEVETVTRGDASVAVTTRDDRPQIVVNLKRVKAEKHRLSSRLLKLAKVIR